MIQLIAILLVIAGSVSRTQAEWPIGKVKMGHGVVGGGGCYIFEVYVTGDCTGEPWHVGGWTTGASIEDGCEDSDDGTSRSIYCDNDGFHMAYFNSSSDCSGVGESKVFWPNSCDEFGDYSESNFCTMNGPCDVGGVKSME
eukprot:CAMPEP_0172479078 /NCGR_PEP_ID=MMETSP1066-20121228/3402_1 /TAXON_ID=671091 /ORGANISM="Coscinodiscus wailesii, Strain CCMP2513" /LENGTH=140 /DNA_ID=CAMNT_0013239199 /DNA_START=1939 /DNA_END=2361 /DNA_ORIENTATION=-